MSFLVTSTFSLVNVLKTFAHLQHFCLLLEFEGPYFMLNASPLSDIWITKVTSRGLSFISLMVPFEKETFFTLMRAN